MRSTSTDQCNRELAGFQSILHESALERPRPSWLSLTIVYVACAQLGAVLGALSTVGAAL